MRFRVTVACVRPKVDAWSDDFENTIGAARSKVEFVAAFVPPTTQAGSRIVDGVLRETTITKPTLFIDRRASNASALAAGAIVSGDPITVNGETGWQVDGDPRNWDNSLTGTKFPMVVELRRSDG